MSQKKKKGAWATVRRTSESAYKIESTYCLNGNLNIIVSFPKIVELIFLNMDERKLVLL